jgi:hypothetical protein
MIKGQGGREGLLCKELDIFSIVSGMGLSLSFGDKYDAYYMESWVSSRVRIST